MSENLVELEPADLPQRDWDAEAAIITRIEAGDQFRVVVQCAGDPDQWVATKYGHGTMVKVSGSTPIETLLALESEA